MSFDQDSELEVLCYSCFCNTGIEEITIPASVKRIENQVFSQSKLKKANFPNDSRLEMIGYEGFDCEIEEFIVPPYLKVFKNNSFISSTRLNFERNKYYIDSIMGVIYSRSMRRIIALPKRLKRLIIPESIKEIDKEIFDGKKIKWVKFPSSLKVITQTSTIPYNKIRRITFSKDSKLIKLGSEAFRNTKVSHLIIPSSVEKIKCSAFQACGASKIIFPPDCKIRIFPKRIFIDCSLVHIDIPSSVEVIASESFSYCYNLETINFSSDSKLKKILEYAYLEFNNITSINLENCHKLEIVAPEAFSKVVSDLLNIKTIISMNIDDEGKLTYFDHDVSICTIPDNAKSIGDGVFFRSNIDILEFKETSSLQNIGKYAFALCSYGNEVQKICFPSSLEVIEKYAFYDITWLYETSFGTGSKLQRIKKYAFARCRNLNSILLPQKDVIVEEGAFLQTYDNTNIKFMDTEEEETSEGKLIFDSPTILIPSSVTSIGPLLNKQKTERIEFETESNLKEIHSFGMLTESKDLFLPSTVEKIHYNAFFKIKSLNISNNNFQTNHDGVVTSQCSRAILFVPQHLLTIDIDPELEIIHSYAFYKSKIKSLSLQKSLKIIGKGAFLDSCIESIEFGEGTELEVLDSLSLDCDNLKIIKLPNVRKKVGNSVISGYYHKIIFPKHFKPEHSGGIIDTTKEGRTWREKVILPYSSYKSVIKNYLALNNPIIKVLYDQ